MLLDASLLYFFEVARCGSVRQAGERLHVSPSAISRMISKAEHHFQTELFERQTSGMKLTASGRALFDELGDTVRHLRDAQTRIDELKGLHRGEVVIHCIEGLGAEVMPRILTRFHRLYPAIRFTVNLEGSDAIVAALVSDEAEIGITFNMRRRADVEVLAEIPQRVCALVAPGHSLARLDDIGLSELIKYPIALSNASFGIHRMLDRAIRKLESRQLPLLLTTNSLVMTYGMASAGTCITLSIPVAARSALESGRLVAVPLSASPALIGHMSLCKRRGRHLSTAAAALLDQLSGDFAGALA